MPVNQGRIVFKTALICFLAFGLQSGIAQTVPDAVEGVLPLRVGAGVSSYNTDAFSNRLLGPTVWVDWNFQHVPTFLRGVGAEAEVRDLAWGQPQGLSWSIFTMGGGLIYTRTYHRVFRPYAKFLVNFSEQANIGGPATRLPSWYKTDKWATMAPGGGIDVHAWRHIWVRADYEYQFWKVEWFNDHYLNPQGATLGIIYDIRSSRRFGR